MPKSREDFDSEEAYLQHRLEQVRHFRDKAREELAEQMPYAAWAKRAMALEEAAMWERIRTEFPKQKGWAANLAAHHWTVKLEGDRLYVIGKDCQYVSVLDAEPEKTSEFPACCAACKHRGFIESTRGVAYCGHHRHRVLEAHVCEDYEQHTGQTPSAA
jgi:hypothetical protein